MVAFGNRVILRKTPHAGDRLSPFFKGTTEAFHFLESATLKLGDHHSKGFRMNTALLGLLALLTEQIVKLLFEDINGFDLWMLLKVSLQSKDLLGLEIAGMSTNQRDQSSVQRADSV
tara:strand:+ start:1077 stop:1427 length:351 start_codon:yes stop_codon:yes gene_type:complete